MSEHNSIGPSSAFVDIVAQNNASLTDAFQFDPPPGGLGGFTGCTGPNWTMTGQNFRLDIKGNRQQPAFLLSLTSAAGQIVVDDATQRILHFNVPDTILAAALVPGEYLYDFIMYDNSVPSVRVPLMHGRFVVPDGITGN